MQQSTNTKNLVAQRLLYTRYRSSSSSESMQEVSA